MAIASRRRVRPLPSTCTCIFILLLSHEGFLLAASSSASRGRGSAMGSGSGSGSGLGIDAETLRSLGMSSSEINSLLGTGTDGSSPSSPPSLSKPRSSGLEASPTLENMGNMDIDMDENYDDYDEYEYDADFDALEEEQEDELEDDEDIEQEEEEDIFALQDDGIPESYLSGDLEEEEEEEEEEDEEFIAASDDSIAGIAEEEDDADIGGGWLNKESLNESDLDEDENDEDKDENVDDEEYDLELEEEEENYLDEDNDVFVDENDEDDDDETFFSTNEAEMADLDDLEEDDFADELPPEEEVLEMEERLIQQQDGSIPLAEDEIDQDEYEEYDFEDDIEGEEGFETETRPALVVKEEEELEPPDATVEEEETTIQEDKNSEYDVKDLAEDGELNLDGSGAPSDEIQGDESAPKSAQQKVEGEERIGNIANSENISNDEKQEEEEEEGGTVPTGHVVNEPKHTSEADLELESKLEPETKPELEPEVKKEPESESEPSPELGSNTEKMVIAEEPKPASEPELESKGTAESPVLDSGDNALTGTDANANAEPHFSDINSVKDTTKTGKVALGSALPILLPKIGRSLVGSPVAVQIFAIASVGNIALQHMGALKRKRKDHLTSSSTATQRTRPTMVETTTATTADDAFDAAIELDYEESDYVEDVEGYGFGRPRPQRRSYRQTEEEEGGAEDVIEYVEESNNNSMKGLGRFGWGPLRRKAKKSDSDITIVDTSVTFPDTPAIPKKRGIAFGLMGKNTLEQEFDKALKEIEILKIRAKKAEDTRDQLEIDCDSAMHQLREARKNLSEVSKTNNYLKNQLADNKRILERAVNVERQKTNTELTRLREQMVEVLERERRMMKAQLAKSSTEMRAMIDDSLENEYEYVEQEYDAEE